MVKIALDPAMYHATLSVPDELRKAADLGYEYLELSPRPDWFFWHRYPKADDAMIAEVNLEAMACGAAVVLDFTGGVAATPDFLLEPEHFEAHVAAHGPIPDGGGQLGR